MKVFFTRAVVLLVSLLALAVFAGAQTSRGTVSGVVHDPSGAVVNGADVVMTSTATGQALTTKTNTAGIYRFEAVIPGDYTVSVQATGFAANKAPVSVVAGLAVGHDVDLKVGSSDQTVQVEATAAALQTEDATRSASIQAAELAVLPIAGQNSLNLMLIAPGVAKSNQGGSLDSGIGAVNGARARSNNFMIDGANNNDISVAGPSFTLFNNDAIQEVSIQTSNFTAEFGRSGGAVVNQVIKTGSNSLHGTAAEVYRSEALNASTRTQRNSFATGATTDLKSKFKENIPAFTIGGPVYIPHIYDGRSKTFFFVAGQWDRYSANSLNSFGAVPTDAGVAVLQPLAATCPNVAKYLALLGPTRGVKGNGSSAQTISIALPSNVAASSCGGGQRIGQGVEVGGFDRRTPEVFLDNNHLVKFDHTISTKQNFTFRWLYDRNSDNLGNVGINPAFDIPFRGLTESATLNHVYVFKTNLLNEFRFSYTRYNYGWFFSDNSSLGATTPDIQITSMSSLAVSSTFPQGRIANSYQYQDTVGWTHGKHAFRFGGEIMRQLSKQVAPFNSRGIVGYSSSASNAFTGGAITGLANFIDDYSGTNANPVQITFGSGLYRPNIFTYSLFLQDSWKVFSDLTLNLGLRYENFGQPANGFKYPAFVGYADADALTTARVKPDNNNFAPNVGFSWAPHSSSGIGRFLTGDGKFVLRGGYQIGYDTWFNNLLSNMAAGSPNALSNTPVPGSSSAATPRGVKTVSAILPTLVPVAVTPYSSMTSVFNQDIVNPYYHRFSLGVQRQIAGGMMVDLAYVGSLGRQLFFTNPLNPALPNATQTGVGVQANGQTLRLYPNRGLIQTRDSGLSSNYNSMQVQVSRRMTPMRFLGSMGFQSSYTWSKNLDVLSETFATNSSGQNPSRSPAFGTSLRALDYGPSDNDRRHIWSTAVLWSLPGPKNGVLGQFVGGWSVYPIITLQSGTPFTVLNGSDRDFDGSTLGDRPNIGNIAAPLNTFGKVVAAGVCSTGLQNPANNACVTSNDVHWVQVTAYSPTSPLIAARNSNYTDGLFTLDANVLKTVRISEGVKFEYRAEIFNLTNKENMNNPVSSANRNVTSASGTSFLNYSKLNGGSRTMRMGVKLIF